MTKATISASGQLRIPKAIRERLNLRPGTQVALDVQDHQVVLKPLVTSLPDWRTMQGMVRTGPSLTQALEEEHAAEVLRDRDRS
ncbi:MAG: AbrB/MazE/SpoVT family DNA-binding domain-containing protein [Acidobacteria bacterium]|nr:AbrB/MazE/SpoVT family DNA-binding domain-containing protein [Acidobacteriota bacterium]